MWAWARLSEQRNKTFSFPHSRLYLEAEQGGPGEWVPCALLAEEAESWAPHLRCQGQGPGCGPTPGRPGFECWQGGLGSHNFPAEAVDPPGNCRKRVPRSHPPTGGETEAWTEPTTASAVMLLFTPPRKAQHLAVASRASHTFPWERGRAENVGGTGAFC